MLLIVYHIYSGFTRTLPRFYNISSDYWGRSLKINFQTNSFVPFTTLGREF